MMEKVYMAARIFALAANIMTSYFELMYFNINMMYWLELRNENFDQPK